MVVSKKTFRWPHILDPPDKFSERNYFFSYDKLLILESKNTKKKWHRLSNRYRGDLAARSTLCRMADLTECNGGGAVIRSL